MGKEKSFEEKFRSRWLRWLGQKCRFDRHVWTELLQSNWLSWVEEVYFEASIEYKPIGPYADRITVFMLYKKAIEVCTLDQMHKLDGMWCEDNMEKKYK